MSNSCLELELVLAQAVVDVALAVRQALDEAGHQVRGRLGDDRRPQLQDGVDAGHTGVNQDVAGEGVDADRDRDRDQAAEKVPVDGAFGQPAEQVVADQVNPVGQSHEPIQQKRVGARGDAEAAVQDDGLDDIIQKGHGKAGEHQGIGRSGSS